METDTASVLDDPRWHAFNSEGFACSCGERHVGLFPINMQAPMGWPGPKEYENDNALRTDGNFLSSQFMRLGREVLRDADAPAADHPWRPAGGFHVHCVGKPRKVDFEAYLEARREGKLKNDARARARLVNRISGFENTAA